MSGSMQSRAPVRRVLCMANRSLPACAEAVDALMRELGSAGFEVEEGAEAFRLKEPELIVVLGGDGFLMESLRLLGYPCTPVYGANFGSVGFLMNRKESLGELISTVREWEFTEEEHSVLEGETQLEDGSVVRLLAFNDIAVERMSRQSLRLEVQLDGVPFNRFAGDGFVLSTTAGSTAYNLAAGGPVVHPALQVVLLTPLYPHRASPFHSMQFPLVVPRQCVIRIVAMDLPKRKMRVVCDGEAVERAASVTVRDSGKKVKLLRPFNHVFVKTLARKFIDSSP